MIIEFVDCGVGGVEGVGGVGGVWKVEGEPTTDSGCEIETKGG